MIKTKSIDSVEFSAAPFMAVEALRLKAFMVKTFGPALGQMIGTFKIKGGLPESGDIGDLDLDGGAMAGAIEKLMIHLDEDSFINLIKRLFANLTAKGNDEKGQPFMRQFDGANFELSLQIVFSGRLFSIYPVILLVLEANYPDFFGKMVRSIGSRIKATATTGPASGTGTSASGNSGTSESSTLS